jgi:hypothetical protein
MSMTHRFIDHQNVKVEGEITLDISLFPESVIRQLMGEPGILPRLNIQLDKVVLPDGISLEADSAGTTVTFEFAGSTATIKEN